MYTLKKSEKLCSKKLMDELFLRGKSFIVFPFRVTFLKYEIQSEFPVQVLFIVSKKRFKKAHDRNRMKRLMRESYRLTKQDFYTKLESKNLQLLISINYIAQEEIQLEQQKKQFLLIYNKIVAENN